MAELTLEIVEGPGAGTSVHVDRPLVIGRADDADLVIDDAQVSRHHARVSPVDGAVTVEDLNSSNGTFINHDEVHAPTRVDPGDELLVGVSVIELRSAAQVAAQPSAVRVVPPALAKPAQRPTYTDPVAYGGEHGHDGGAARSDLSPELQKLRDARVRFQARTAPLAILVLVALIVAIYLATR